MLPDIKETARQAKTEKRKAVEFERIEKAKKKHESEVNELFDKTASSDCSSDEDQVSFDKSINVSPPEDKNNDLVQPDFNSPPPDILIEGKNIN